MTTENLVVADTEGEEDTKWLQRGVTATVILTAIAGLLIVFLVNPSTSGSTLNFLLINDIHLDLNYKNISSPNVDFCRSSISTLNISKPYGQYGCDTPLTTFKSMLNYAKGFAEEISFIVLGGNIIPHNVTLSREENDDIQNFVKNEITSVFPDKQIYMILGNTDFTDNYGSFAEDDVDFKALSAIYSPFLPDDQKESFKNGGYYFVDFEDYNARILFLNSVIYSKERKLNESNTDPYNQFSFIERASKEAKELGYGVGIVMHLPPSSGSLKESSNLVGFHEIYAKRFYEVTKNNDIQFIISCHTHIDSFLPTYKKGMNNLYTISSPSVSPNEGSNPSFRLFRLRNRVLEDYQQFYADLVFGTSGNNLQWDEEYRFTSSYSVDDLSSENIQKTVNFIQNTGSGRWMYRERVMVRADENSPYYYCLINSFDANETEQCMKSLGEQINADIIVPKYYSDEI